jgi:O-6-methylguanine DNA methyltransferase
MRKKRSGRPSRSTAAILRSRDFRYRGSCSTGVVTVGRTKLRVAWTHAGVAFADHVGDTTIEAVERRLKMRLEPRPVPKIIRDALAAAAKGAKEIDVPIDLTWATEYEREVLSAALSIPWGQTRPYSWLAREARRPLAVRAAASAIAKNPLWLLIPCHRVIAANGKIGSYGPSGVGRKRELLAREGVKL